MVQANTTQHSASVLEFACLYTYDVRRKNSKRWHDGRLTFHTFNRRAMLYESPTRNLLGDTHCDHLLEGSVLQDGDELTLEKCGALVQVCELVQQKHTDLREVVRTRKSGEWQQKFFGRRDQSGPYVDEINNVERYGGNMKIVGGAQVQQKHKSLNSLLGTKKSPIGKTHLPAQSPFEVRYGGLSVENQRPAKRRCMDSEHDKRVSLKTHALVSKGAPPKDWPKSNQREFVDLSDSDEQRPVLLDLSCNPAVTSQSPTTNERSTKAKTISRKHSSIVNSSISVISDGNCAHTNNELFEHKSTADGVKTNLKSMVILDDTSIGHNKAIQTAKSPLARRTSLSDSEGATLHIARTMPKRTTLLCQNQLQVGRGHLPKPSNRNKGQMESETYIDVSENKVVQRRRLNSLPGMMDKNPISKINENSDININKITSATRDVVQPFSVNEDENTGTRTTDRREDCLTEASDPKISSPCQHEFVDASKRHKPPDPKNTRYTRTSSHENGAISNNIITNRQPKADTRGKPPLKTLQTTKQQILSTTECNKVPINNIVVNPRNQAFRKPQLSKGQTSAETITGASKLPDPWSREAFDLFSWRPPDWDESAWCVRVTADQPESAAKSV